MKAPSSRYWSAKTCTKIADKALCYLTGDTGAFGVFTNSPHAAIEGLVHELGHYWAVYLTSDSSADRLLRFLLKDRHLDDHVGVISSLGGTAKGDRHEIDALAATILVLEPVLDGFNREALLTFGHASLRARPALRDSSYTAQKVLRALKRQRTHMIADRVRTTVTAVMRQSPGWVDHPEEIAGTARVVQKEQRAQARLRKYEEERDQGFHGKKRHVAKTNGI